MLEKKPEYHHDDFTSRWDEFCWGMRLEPAEGFILFNREKNTIERLRLLIKEKDASGFLKPETIRSLATKPDYHDIIHASASAEEAKKELEASLPHITNFRLSDTYPR